MVLSGSWLEDLDRLSLFVGKIKFVSIKDSFIILSRYFPLFSKPSFYFFICDYYHYLFNKKQNILPWSGFLVREGDIALSKNICVWLINRNPQNAQFWFSSI